MSSYVNFHILVTSPGEVQAAYAHKTFGVNDVSISVTVTPSGITPSFNMTAGVKSVNYLAGKISVSP